MRDPQCEPEGNRMQEFIDRSARLPSRRGTRPVVMRGFTLIEMMIVIVVIGILIGILLPSFRGTQDEASIQRARSELRTIATALESYYIHNSNAFPAALSSLTSATPRILNVIPDDPFRTGSNDYTYAISDNGSYYVIFAYGTDRDVDISGINNSGQMTEAGDCTGDVWVSNGVGTDASGNPC